MAKINHNRPCFAKRPRLSIEDENEQLERDKAARWLKEEDEMTPREKAHLVISIHEEQQRERRRRRKKKLQQGFFTSEGEAVKPRRRFADD